MSRIGKAAGFNLLAPWIRRCMSVTKVAGKWCVRFCLPSIGQRPPKNERKPESLFSPVQKPITEFSPPLQPPHGPARTCSRNCLFRRNGRPPNSAAAFKPPPGTVACVHSGDLVTAGYPAKRFCVFTCGVGAQSRSSDPQTALGADPFIITPRQAAAPLALGSRTGFRQGSGRRAPYIRRPSRIERFRRIPCRWKRCHDQFNPLRPAGAAQGLALKPRRRSRTIHSPSNHLHWQEVGTAARQTQDGSGAAVFSPNANLLCLRAGAFDTLLTPQPRCSNAWYVPERRRPAGIDLSRVCFFVPGTRASGVGVGAV